MRRGLSILSANPRYMEFFTGNYSDREISNSPLSIFVMHLVSCFLWYLYANFVSLLCDYRVVSFQVTDSGYQPSWQMKNNSAGAISLTSDPCLWDNSSLRFLSLLYCVLKGPTQGSGLVPLSKVSIKTCRDIKEVTRGPPQQCLMLHPRF